MTVYDEGLINVIDARIARAAKRQDAFGTVTSRDTVGPGAMVTFDGSTLAVPVKVFGHVHCIEDDRVALTLIETTWCVIGSFSRRQLSEARTLVTGTNPASVTSSNTYTDMPNTPQIVSFPKRYDGTAMRVALSTTLWTSVADTNAQIGVRVAGKAGTETAETFTPIDALVGRLQLDTILERGFLYGTSRLVVPAGEYTLTARWRRILGTGELRQDDKDQTLLEADEIFRIVSN